MLMMEGGIFYCDEWKKTTTGNLSEFTVVSGELICCKWIVDKLQKEGG